MNTNNSSKRSNDNVENENKSRDKRLKVTESKSYSINSLRQILEEPDLIAIRENIVTHVSKLKTVKYSWKYKARSIFSKIVQTINNLSFLQVLNVLKYMFFLTNSPSKNNRNEINNDENDDEYSGDENVANVDILSENVDESNSNENAAILLTPCENDGTENVASENALSQNNVGGPNINVTIEDISQNNVNESKSHKNHTIMDTASENNEDEFNSDDEVPVVILIPLLSPQTKYARALKTISSINMESMLSQEIVTQPDYYEDVIQHWTALETKYIVSKPSVKTFIESRQTYIGYILELSERYCSTPETLFHAVKIMDLFLGKQTVSLQKGDEYIPLCCYLIADKINEYFDFHITVIDLFIFDWADPENTFVVVELEKLILHTLNFNLRAPNQYAYLKEFFSCMNINPPLFVLARYIITVALLDPTFIEKSALHMAIAAMRLAFMMRQAQQSWPDTMNDITKCPVNQIEPLMRQLNIMLRKINVEALPREFTWFNNELLYNVASVASIPDEEFDNLINQFKKDILSIKLVYN